MKYYLCLYFKIQCKNIRSLVEYRTDFLLMTLFTTSGLLCNIIFLKIIYSNISTINGWNMWEILILYSMLLFSEGSVNLFFQGSWKISELINSGDLDRFLLRPAPVGLQLLTSKIDFDGLNKIILAIIIFFVSEKNLGLHWSIKKIIIFFLLAANACVIRVCLTWISSCLSFWMQSSRNSINFLLLSIGEIAKYPMVIYPIILRATFFYLIPYAFVSYYPATYILHDTAIIPILCLSCGICLGLFLLSKLILSRGLRRYESAGN